MTLEQRADFVFAAHGTWGDVGPMADVAVQLVRHGARVTFISTPWFEGGLKARGLSVVTVGEPWNPREALADPRLSHPLTGAVDIWRLVFAPLVAPMLEATVAALRGKQGVVVMHPWCLGAQLGAELAGAAWVGVALAPITWFSVADAPVASRFELPGWLARAVMRGPMRLVLRKVFGKTLDDEARRRGLPPHGDRFFRALQDAALNLAFWPAAFRPAAADDPPRVVLCGFPAAPHRAQALEPQLAEFLATGAAPVVMGLGSALPELAQDIYDAVEAAVVSLGHRAVLVGAASRQSPPGVLRVAHAPYAALFEHGRLIVHHGGIGTTAEGLAAGRPQLVIPFGADQYDNAARLERLGVGRRVVRAKVTVARVRSQLEALLDDANAAVVAADLAGALRDARPGVELAAEALLALR